MNASGNHESPMRASELLFESRKARAATWAGSIILAANLIGLIYMIVMSFNVHSWQVYALAVVFGLLAGVSILAFRLSRGGRPIKATIWLIASLVVSALAIGLLSTGTGMLIGVIAAIAILVLAIQTLPQRWTNWAILVGVLAGLVAGLFEFYSPFTVEKPGFRNALTIVCGVGVGIFIIYMLLQFRNLSLTNKFVVSFLAVTIGVSGAVVYFTNRNSSIALTNRVGNELNALASVEGQSVGDLLDRQVAMLESLSMDELIKSEVKNSDSHYIIKGVNIQDEINQFDKQWIVADAANNNNDPLVLEHLNNPASADLKRFNATFPDNVETFITDFYGALVATSNRTSDYNQADEGWWQSAFNNGVGAVYIGSPEFDASSGTISINIALPVRETRTGALLGIIRTTYELNGLESILSSGNLGKTGQAEIYFPGANAQVVTKNEVKPVDAKIVSMLATVANQPYAQLTLNNIPVLSSQSKVRSTNGNPDVSNLGWNMSVHQDISEAMAPVAAQTRTNFLFVMVIIAIVVFGAILLSQYLARPILTLTETAERVREGDLNAQAKVTTADEVGELAITFNEMTTRLRQTLTGLEQRVKERTRELTLSADVGRNLSEEHDLDLLLKDAVEKIQSTFDLYYTQIYLTDLAGRELILRSGTGEVGAELMSRRHSLTISLGSINGSAAANKKPVIVEDTATSKLFRPNPLLPDTRSEMAVPLIVSDRVVGVLDMQSDRPNALSPENLAAFQSLAGQLAIAIENASLLTQAQTARSELESQARRLTQTGWQDFLNAIERSENIGFLYDRKEVKEISEPISSETDGNSLTAPLQVTGEQIGRIKLERDTEEKWTEADVQMVNAVASQIVRQIDNLRLLAQAESYRAEAEDAARRLTRQGWESYIEQNTGQEIGFSYDQTRVLPDTLLQSGTNVPIFSLPLQVRGETIGELEIDGETELDDESVDLIRNVADRLSTHIESLRLSAQTRSALIETETLYNIIAEMNAAGSYDDILDALSKRTLFNRADQLLIMAVFDKPLTDSEMPEWIIPVASRAESGIEIASRYPLNAFEAVPHTLFTDRPAILTRLSTDQRLDRVTRTLFKEVFQAESSIIIPLMLGDRSIGFVQGYFSKATDFPEAEVERLAAVASQAAIAIESRLLLEQAQTRARQEQRIREATSQVFEASDIDTIMRRAVEQVGKVLGVPAYIYLGDGHLQNGQSDPKSPTGDGHSQKGQSGQGSPAGDPEAEKTSVEAIS